MSLRTSVFSVTTLSFQQTTSRIIIYSDSNISTVEIIPGGTSQRPKLRRWPLNNTVGSYPHLLASYHNAWNATLGNVTKAIRCYKDLYIYETSIFPRKLTCPLKNCGWKTALLFWNGPFLGDRSVCVLLCKNLGNQIKSNTLNYHPWIINVCWSTPPAEIGIWQVNVAWGHLWSDRRAVSLKGFSSFRRHLTGDNLRLKPHCGPGQKTTWTKLGMLKVKGHGYQRRWVMNSGHL